MFSFPGYVPGVSEKKYGVEKWQYFMNGAIYQCSILRHGNYNFLSKFVESFNPICQKYLQL